MSALIWSAYLLTVVTVYERVRTRFPSWEGRAELVSIGVGLGVLLAAVGVWEGTHG